ncbi:MAG: hypothetical protein C4K49_02135 [Candidatus Thorarchaeota archaeon]|nr:MAG: hypothetical protein C4K49_02135 [Candidatus Thorarchaeota archaeon]
MAEDTLEMRYEFFSWRGFAAGAAIIAASLFLQSIIGFPSVWESSAVAYLILMLLSGLVVGTASGGVLVYLIPPDQDVIGLSGLGSDDATQHVALLLVLLALVQPVISAYLVFPQFFGVDPLAAVWVLVAFAAPSIGFAAAMLDRQKAIAADLSMYFSYNDRLDMVTLQWLHGLGPRTATYRMGMLEKAASRVKGVRVKGHEIVREGGTLPTNH